MSLHQEIENQLVEASPAVQRLFAAFCARRLAPLFAATVECRHEEPTAAKKVFALALSEVWRQSSSDDHPSLLITVRAMRELLDVDDPIKPDYYVTCTLTVLEKSLESLVDEPTDASVSSFLEASELLHAMVSMVQPGDEQAERNFVERELGLWLKALELCTLNARKKEVEKLLEDKSVERMAQRLVNALRQAWEKKR